MSAPLVKSLNLEIKGVAPTQRLAGLIVLGIELLHRKRALGYDGPGSWQAFREESKSGARMHWPKYCEAEADISDTMAKHYHQCADAVRMRLRISSKPGAKELLQDMETPPSEMTAEQRLALVDRIAKIGLVPGDTQIDLRKDLFRAARLPADKATRHEVSPWPADDVEEIRQRAIGMKPIVVEETQIRNAALARLAIRAYHEMKEAGTLQRFSKP